MSDNQKMVITSVSHTFVGNDSNDCKLTDYCPIVGGCIDAKARDPDAVGCMLADVIVWYKYNSSMVEFGEI
jgi:hypothetical protein